MPAWKRFFFIGAGFGTAVVILAVAIAGGWGWYQSRPQKPRPWNASAIIATFDHPDTEPGPEKGDGVPPNDIVLYYTLENMTEFDYQLPLKDHREINAKLKESNSIVPVKHLIALDEGVFVPGKQRVRIKLTMHFAAMTNLSYEDTKENRRKRGNEIVDHLKNEFSNIDGFVMFDPGSRYQINFPGDWKSKDSK